MTKLSNNMLGYKCSCGAEVETPNQFVAHCKERHPNDPLGLYDTLGTIGDEYADIAIKELKDEIKTLMQDREIDSVRLKENKDYKQLHDTLHKEHVELQQKFNLLKFKYAQTIKACEITKIATNLLMSIINDLDKLKI